MWCFIVPCPALMCCAVLMHVTYLVKTTSHDSAPPPLLLYKPEPHIAVDIPRGLPPPLPCPCPCLTNPAFPQISPDFNPNLAELTDQYWSYKKRLRTESRHHLCAVEMRRTIKRGVPRPFDWIHRFPWLAELGTLILFVHLHWDSARFMLMNAPDSTIWPLQGNSGEHNRGPIPTPRLSAIRKREIEWNILPQRLNLENFFLQWFLAFSLTCMCQNACVYRFRANQ